MKQPAPRVPTIQIVFLSHYDVIVCPAAPPPCLAERLCLSREFLHFHCPCLRHGRSRPRGTPWLAFVSLLSPEGAIYHSPGQRPGSPSRLPSRSPVGAKYTSSAWVREAGCRKRDGRTIGTKSAAWELTYSAPSGLTQSKRADIADPGRWPGL